VSDNVRFNGPLIEKVANAMRELGDVQPRHARALVFAAAASLGENTPLIEATRDDLADKAELTPKQAEDAFEKLEFIRALQEFDSDDAQWGFPVGLTLHPDLAWRGDDLAKRKEMADRYMSLVLL
jgi:hypothetical protein